jgi:uncharacterized protein
MDDDPGLPIKLDPCSNGEIGPLPATPLVREAQRRARRLCEEQARRLGMDRREFLVSSMGAAATLLALSACSSEESGGRSGGRYDVPEEATVDADAALETLGSDEPVFDVQTHLLEYPSDYDGPGIGFLFPFAESERCGEEDPNDCFTTERWIDEVFARSDTTMVVLSALAPIDGPDPISAEVMARARDQAIELCGDGRVLVQGHAWPNVGRLAAALDAMTAEREEHPELVAWKTYTHVAPSGVSGYRLTDDLGEALLGRIEEIGPPILCVHKGLVNGAGVAIGDPELASPADVGPAAAAHPDVTFCVYHSGAEVDVREGPYDPAAPGGGTDRLVKSLEDAGIGPDGNVYAELGSTWHFKMGDPDQAAHLLGKLLVAVGEDRILWGTDSIWFGSPQDQIQAFRSFRISDELQERYGYPALTDEIRHKILWRNAARLYDVEVPRRTCEPDAATTEEARRWIGRRLGNRTYGPTTPVAARRLFLAEHPWLV